MQLTVSDPGEIYVTEDPILMEVRQSVRLSKECGRKPFRKSGVMNRLHVHEVEYLTRAPSKNALDLISGRRTLAILLELPNDWQLLMSRS